MWCRIHTPVSSSACLPQRYARCCTFCAPTAACTLHVCVCWLSESHALPVSRHYTVHPLPANTLAIAHIRQSIREVYFKTCALRHHLHCTCKLRGAGI